MAPLQQALLALPLVTAVPLSPRNVPDFTTSEAGNPFVDGWYADPDTEYYNNEYWIFPTYSAPYEEQTHLDAFSSPDLVHWTKHANIVNTTAITWAHKAMWAPATIHRDGKYYLYFGANDILQDEIEQGLVGGIGVAVAESPEGPYVDAIGKPLIGEFHNGAQPIDQDVFIDDDGQAYIYYGGHSHANVAKLNDDMISLGTFDDGSTFKEITPENYVEGSQMMKRNGVYYFMWSEGGWTGPDYSVSYAMSDSPLGPFERLDKILEQDPAVARGSGHNAVIKVPDTDIWYIVYHRRPLSETDGNHRVACYDRMYFEDDGTIRKVQMLIKDNFEDGNMLGWNNTDGWAVESGKLVGEGMAILDSDFADVRFDAKVNFGQGVAGLVFRAESVTGGDHYFARLSSKGVEVGLNHGGEERIIATSDSALSNNTEYSVRVLAVEQEIEVFVDNMKVAAVTASDDNLKTGANGVVAVGKGGFDDVSVARP